MTIALTLFASHWAPLPRTNPPFGLALTLLLPCTGSHLVEYLTLWLAGYCLPAAAHWTCPLPSTRCSHPPECLPLLMAGFDCMLLLTGPVPALSLLSPCGWQIVPGAEVPHWARLPRSTEALKKKAAELRRQRREEEHKLSSRQRLPHAFHSQLYRAIFVS